jgi:hypothetical protein
MRRTLMLLFVAGVFGLGAGCCRTLQHTAGVCDCDPPPVESVLGPYQGITPAAEPVAPTVFAEPVVAPEPPKKKLEK